MRHIKVADSLKAIPETIKIVIIYIGQFVKIQKSTNRNNKINSIVSAQCEATIKVFRKKRFLIGTLFLKKMMKASWV